MISDASLLMFVSRPAVPESQYLKHHPGFPVRTHKRSGAGFAVGGDVSGKSQAGEFPRPENRKNASSLAPVSVTRISAGCLGKRPISETAGSRCASLYRQVSSTKLSLHFLRGPMFKRRHFLAVILIAQLSVAAFAQQSRTPITEPPPPPPRPKTQQQKPEDIDVVRITTNLVQVDAVVTDRNGKVVTDLKPEEVRIFEDGKPQKITHFS